MKKIIKDLIQAGLSNSNDFINTYVDHEDEIITSIGKQSGIKSEFYCRYINAIDNYKIHYYPRYHEKFVKQDVVLPRNFFPNGVPTAGQIRLVMGHLMRILSKT